MNFKWCILSKLFQYFHEKIRNYECSYCEKKFQAKKLLYNHVQSIHLGEKTNCPDCKKDISVDNFSRHVRETHERVGLVIINIWFVLILLLLRLRNPVPIVRRSSPCQTCPGTSGRSTTMRAQSALIAARPSPFQIWTNTSNLFTRSWRKHAISVTKKFPIQALGMTLRSFFKVFTSIYIFFQRSQEESA